jgi:uncharacterized protein (DUF58 family)
MSRRTVIQPPITAPGSGRGSPNRAAAPGQRPDWFPEELERRLRAGTVRLRGRTAGRTGEAQAPRPGGDGEFVDHRPYHPGDDLRTIDWNVAARHDRLHVKRSAQQQRHAISIVVDASASMRLPLDPYLGERAAGLPGLTSRLAAGLQAAAATTTAVLAERAAGAGRRVDWTIVDADSPARCTRTGPLTSAPVADARLRSLPDPAAIGPGPVFAEAVARIIRADAQPADRLVITDGLRPVAIREALRRLRPRAGFRTGLLLIAPHVDADPDLSGIGAVRLIDAEGDATEVVLDDPGAARDLYRREFAAAQAQLAQTAAQFGIGLARLDPLRADPDELMRAIRATGILG